MRVAAVQAAAIPGDVRGNVATAARLTRRAVGLGAELAVFPELFVPAYHPPTLAASDCHDLRADEQGLVADQRLDPLAEAAEAAGAAVLIGASVRHPGQRRSISLLFIGSGPTRVVYDKQHLWGSDEPGLFTSAPPGAGPAVVAFRGWQLGLGVCYDASFPEHARAAALAGAHAYLCPSVFLVGRDHRRDVYFRARALENTMYVVFTNAIAGAGAWQFSGGAAIFDPEGRELGRGPASAEAVICADFDPAELARIRAMLPMLADCRRDLPGTVATSGPARPVARPLRLPGSL
jgi:predicted amidohydrolase